MYKFGPYIISIRILNVVLFNFIDNSKLSMIGEVVGSGVESIVNHSRCNVTAQQFVT